MERNKAAEEPLWGWVQITAGVGPVECQWTVAQVLAALQTEAATAGVTLDLLDAVPGEAPDTLRSVLLAARGPAASLLPTWAGSVQWRGRSPFRPQHRRRSFFVGVEVLQPPDTRATKLDPRDLTFEAVRMGGPGGQHANKTETAVRVRHEPTGVIAMAREERSQHQNRRLALARLAVLLAEREAAAQAQADKARWAQHRDLVRGAPVRIYEGPAFTRRS